MAMIIKAEYTVTISGENLDVLFNVCELARIYLLQNGYKAGYTPKSTVGVLDITQADRVNMFNNKIFELFEDD